MNQIIFNVFVLSKLWSGLIGEIFSSHRHYIVFHVIKKSSCIRFHTTYAVYKVPSFCTGQAVSYLKKFFPEGWIKTVISVKSYSMNNSLWFNKTNYGVIFFALLIISAPITKLVETATSDLFRLFKSGDPTLQCDSKRLSIINLLSLWLYIT